MEVPVPATIRLSIALVVLACVAWEVGLAQAPQRGGTPATDAVQPVNSGAESLSRDPRLGAVHGREAASGADPTASRSTGTARPSGRRIGARRRPRPAASGTNANPMHHFDESGREIRSFGGGMFVWPHGIHVDRDGNVWVTDARAPRADDLRKFPGEQGKGSVVVKFSPDGQRADDDWHARREGKSSRSAHRIRPTS